MNDFLRNQVNIFSFILLIFVFLLAFRNLDRKDRLNRSFLLTIIGVVIGLLAESTTNLLNGNANSGVIVINNIFSAILFLVAPVISYNFFVFIYYLIFQGKPLNKTIQIILIIPVISNFIFSVLSPFFGLFFSISDLGVYSRGPLWMLSAFSTYIFMILGVVLVFVNYKKMLKQDFWLILGIGIFPVIGGLIQAMFYGVFTMWSCAAVALILGYLFLLDRMIRLDSQTGAWNRESFFITYSRRIQLNPEKTFGAIYFDIDNLKTINDTYGHLEGDNAIQLVMETIHESIPDGYTICRLGGDEFIILRDCEEQSQITSVLENIKEQFKTSPKIKEKKYNLECSFSAGLYNSEFSSLNAFLSKLDFLMYEDKFSKKFKK